MPVDHSRAQELISERMDGERLPSRVTTALEEHLEHCAECRAFEGGAFTIREWARFEVAPAVPDLVDRIVARAAEERPARPRLWPVRPRPFRSRSPFATIAPAVAALLVGALVGSLVVGGPFARPQRQEAIAATEISQGVARAAASLTAYQATYQITERHFSPEVPVRELSMNVWFRAPERFRLDVVDHTVYPTTDQSPTDMQLVVNGSSWATTGPAPCGLARCPERRTVVHHRAPFSSATPVPTDLVLPVTTLSDPSAVRVIGSGTVLGRTAVEVELPFDRAGPLFPFLQLGGAWRPFHPNDRRGLLLHRTPEGSLPGGVVPAGGPAPGRGGDEDHAHQRAGANRPAAHHAGRGRRPPALPCRRRAAGRRSDRDRLREGRVLAEARRDPELDRGCALRTGRVARPTGRAAERRGRLLRTGDRRPRSTAVDPRPGGGPLPGDEPVSRAPALGGRLSAPAWNPDPRGVGPIGRQRAREPRACGGDAALPPPAAPAPARRLRVREHRARAGRPAGRGHALLPAALGRARDGADPLPRRARRLAAARLVGSAGRGRRPRGARAVDPRPQPARVVPGRRLQLARRHGFGPAHAPRGRRLGRSPAIGGSEAVRGGPLGGGAGGGGGRVAPPGGGR